jgi:hypothetical protein
MPVTTRTIFKQVELGVVYLRCADPFAEGEQIERTFTVRRDGELGYVYETLPNGTRRQVCERLGSMGRTLVASEETLITVIRREQRNFAKSGARFR